MSLSTNLPPQQIAWKVLKALTATGLLWKAATVCAAESVVRPDQWENKEYRTLAADTYPHMKPIEKIKDQAATGRTAIRQGSHSGTADEPTNKLWIRGPLVQVEADNSVTQVNEFSAGRLIGHPAFQNLVIRYDGKRKQWNVSAVVRSTNSGQPIQGAAIYVKFSDADFVLVAMSNLHGEVLFSVSPKSDSKGGTIVPSKLYIAFPAVNASLKGATLREYPLRPNE